MSNNKKTDLNITMQQKFNFESASFEEEDTSTYSFRKKRNITKREKELLVLKNKYKKKYNRLLVIVGLLLIVVFGLLLAYFFVKPKYLKVEKIVIKKVMDENIVFLGDSITQGYNLEKYYDDIHVVNSGINGNVTDDILDNMYERVYRYNPSKVFLLIGTNDLQHDKDVDYIYNNIKKIVSEIHNERPNAKIYVESIYPINNSNDKKVGKTMVGTRKNEDIIEINKKLKEYCKTENYTYIDINKKLVNEDGLLNLDYSVEGLHLNDEGYEIVTQELNKYVYKNK